MIDQIVGIEIIKVRIKLTLDLDQLKMYNRCKAVVTSPMAWEYTECFVIGDYTIHEDDNWRTAKRACFDDGFSGSFSSLSS